MQFKSQEEILAKGNVQVFHYSTNTLGLKVMEFGALFLLVMACIVYPFTHFDPKAWMIAPIVLAAASLFIFGKAQKWRRFARTAIVAYDDEFLYIGDNPKKTACIPWNVLDVHNTGLDKEGAGADLMMYIDGEPVRLILFTNVVCIPEFETVLRTMLEHIKENQNKK